MWFLFANPSSPTLLPVGEGTTPLSQWDLFPSHIGKGVRGEGAEYLNSYANGEVKIGPLVYISVFTVLRQTTFRHLAVIQLELI